MYKELPLTTTFNDYCIDLECSGYELIGQGGFGRVFATPSAKHVIKVARKTTNENPDRWFNYAKAVMGIDNPFFPKVESITMYGDYRNLLSFYVARMERLKPLNNNEITGIITDIIQEAILRQWRTEKGMCKTILHYGWIDDEKLIYKSIGGKKKIPDFMDAMRVIKKVKSRYHAEDDIYDANIMRRGRQLVIIDPIC